MPNSLQGPLGAPPANVSHHLRQLEKASLIKPDATKQRSLGGCDHPDCVVPLRWTTTGPMTRGGWSCCDTWTHSGGRRWRTPSYAWD